MPKNLEALLKELNILGGNKYIGSDGIERNLNHFYSFAYNTKKLTFTPHATDEIKSVINSIIDKYMPL